MRPVTDNMVMVGRILLWHAGPGQTGGLGEHITRRRRMRDILEDIMNSVKISKVSSYIRLAFHRGMWYYKVIFYGGQTPDQNASGRNHNE